MKFFTAIAFILFPSLVFAQAPSIYDIWRPTFDFGVDPAIIITPDSWNFAEPTQTDSAIRKEKRDTLYRVIFDSAQAKGRLLVKSGKDNVAVIRFHLSDEGVATFSFAEMSNGVYSSLEDAIAGSAGPVIESRHIMHLSSSKRYAMFSTLKDPVKLSNDSAISLIKEFMSSIKSLITADRDLVRKREQITYHRDAIRSDIPLLLEDFFVIHGYNPLAYSETFKRFEHDPAISRVIDDMIDTLNVAAGELPRKRMSDRNRGELYEFPPPPTGEEPPPPVLDDAFDIPNPQAKEPPPRETEPVQDNFSDEGKQAAKHHKKLKSKAKAKKQPQAQMPPTDGPGININQTPLMENDPMPDEFIDISEEPKPLQDIQSIVQYPEIAKKASLEGKVIFNALIGKSGQVEKVIIEQSDNKVFDQAVIDAVYKLRFTPAKQNNVPVKVWYMSTVKFKLN
jgi:TonB family protein